MHYYIFGKEMTIGHYYDMGDTVSCLRITEQCRQEYESQGMYQEAANVFPSSIYIHLLQTFESESGVFDSCGNISKGREGYDYSKEIYYLGIHRNDSAEFYFRKILKFHLNHDFLANKGLLYAK